MSGNFYILISLAVSGAINFFTIAVFSRAFNSVEYGIYAMSLSGLAFGYSFLYFWLVSSFIRYTASGSLGISNKKVGIFYFIFGFLAIFTLIIVFLLSKIFILENPNSLFWFVIYMILVTEAGFNILSNHIRFLTLSPKVFAFITIVRSLIALYLGWYLVELNFGFMGALAAIALSFLLCSFFMAFYGKIGIYFKFESIDRSFVKEIFNFGLPIVFILALQTAISSTDRFLLGYHLGAGIAGQYSVSQDLVAKSLIIIAGILHRVYFPVSVKLADAGKFKDLNNQLSKNLSYIMAVVLPASLALVFFAENIVTVLIGKEFQQTSIELMPYHVMTALLNCIVMFYLVTPFYLKKKTKSLILPCLVALLINIIVGFFSIQKLGLIGAIVGSFSAYVFYFVFSFVASRKLFILPIPYYEVLKIAAASACMCTTLLPFKGEHGALNLFLLVVSGLVSYFVFVVAFNVLNARCLIYKKIKLFRA